MNRIILILITILFPLVVESAEYQVKNSAEFITIQPELKAGDSVYLAPGRYEAQGEGKKAKALEWNAKGTASQPIKVIGLSREDFVEHKNDISRHERKFEKLQINGEHTVFSGLRIIGIRGNYNAVSIDGEHIRLTDTNFDECQSNVWLTTGKDAYDIEIDHCSFAGKDFAQIKGQIVRLFAGGSKYPAGHVLHHNQFGPKKTWKSKNGNETLQLFSAGGVNPNRLGEYTYEEDMLIVRNLFDRSCSENEVISAKCDSSFILANTFIRDKELTLRLGRNHTVEANMFLTNTNAPRSCGANNLFRNNYIQNHSAPLKLWGESKGYSGARQNWIVNNTFAFAAPYTASGADKDIYLINNIIVNSINSKSEKWNRKGNLVAVREIEKDTSPLEPAFKTSWDEAFSEDKRFEYEVKKNNVYQTVFLDKLSAESPAKGKAVPHEFAGGIDPYGNLVPPDEANTGCFQEETFKLFKPLKPGDPGPFTQHGQAPIVKVISPLEGATIKGSVEVKVEASDHEGQLAYVYLMLNNQPVSVDSSPPFEWKLDKMLLAETNRIRAVAFDRDGNLSYHRINVLNQSKSSWKRNTKLQEFPKVESPAP